MSDTLEDRFWSKVDCGKPDECWEWQGMIGTYGYGRIRTDESSSQRTHRVAVQLDGRKPDGDMVCHSCDNKSCVNPSHLYIGGRSDNVSDAKRHGRYKQGEDVNQSKLTEAKVRQIRSKYDDGATQQDLADEYDVTQPVISCVVRRETWQHID